MKSTSPSSRHVHKVTTNEAPALWIAGKTKYHTRGQFQQHFTSSFYKHRSQKHKKDSQFKQLSALSGSASIKAARIHIGEIEPRKDLYHWFREYMDGFQNTAKKNCLAPKSNFTYWQENVCYCDWEFVALQPITKIKSE